MASPVHASRLALAAWLAACVLPAAPAPQARAEAGPERDVWIVIDAPAAGERQEGGIDWVRVAGRAGAGERVDHDVALVIDVSGSTALASGADVDGDGRLGKARRRRDDWRPFNPAHYSSDPGDTVLAAELAASRGLVASLARGAARFAVVSFADRARVELPLTGDAEAALATLDGMQARFGSGLTHLADAIAVAGQALQAGGPAEPGRRRVVVLLSDGQPTLPGGEHEAARQALARADAAADAGIEIASFGLGPEALAAGDVFAEIAARTGGRSVHLERPGDVVAALPGMALGAVPSVAIENVSLGAPGRATRVSPDGHFDGFVPLAPGVNLLRVTARDEKAGERRLDRRVEYLPRVPRNEAERRALEARDAAFRRELAERGIAVDLAAEVAARRGHRQERELELSPDDGTAAAGH